MRIYRSLELFAGDVRLDLVLELDSIPARSRSALSNGISCMVEQLGLAMMPS